MVSAGTWHPPIRQMAASPNLHSHQGMSNIASGLKSKGEQMVAGSVYAKEGKLDVQIKRVE